MSRRARKARAEAESSASVVASPYIKRQLPFFDPLDEEQMVKIDKQVDWMLENIGFGFGGDPQAHRIWKEAGVKMDGDKVFADATWVREQCALTPKQFGDVLHSTGHIRAIKKHYPDSHLTLLTADTSKAIYQHNPRVDEIITIDRYRIKHNWYREPLWAWQEISRVMAKIRQTRFDLAIDLQGLVKSVIFLYGAKAERKLVKGNWWGLQGFRDKRLHAIREMDQVLELAGIPSVDTAMEFCLGTKEKMAVDDLLAATNPQANPILIMSPFSRWPSKDWPLENYLVTRAAVADKFHVVFTGAAERKSEVDQAMAQHGLTAPQIEATNLLGTLTLPKLAELVGRAELMLTGDSFPMHLAGAVKTPVIALFGPTDERKTGPLGPTDQVMRIAECTICDKPLCPRRCLAGLDSTRVIQAVRRFCDYP